MDKNTVAEIRRKLTSLQIGTCSCQTKTHEVRYHAERCTYRLACEIEAILDAHTPTMLAYEEVFVDHHRVVREIDVLINGEAGAAKQASLIDLIPQIKERIAMSNRWTWAKPILSGEDTALTNARTFVLAAGLMREEPIEKIVDGAIKAEG